ncbi:MAG: hypothetical protein H7039_16895, partial [Bryobacteraceae bacterium]|nr:hypothetical protein [Bryobacteraceae bacterium]
FGSPKTPVFLEAMLLHQLDTLDSRMECMRGFLQKDRLVEGCWTGYNTTLERSFLKKAKYLEELEKPAPVQQTAGDTTVHVPVLKPAPPPKNGSAFADKLRGALRTEPYLRTEP